MRLLLGTHALLWWLADDGRLGARARNLIEDTGNDILVSVVSLWEIVLKVRVGKLQADIREIGQDIPREGFVLLGIEPEHLVTLTRLPMLHRDPFDHLLMAQALHEDASFISEDGNIRQYAIRVIPCSDPPSTTVMTSA